MEAAVLTRRLQPWPYLLFQMLEGHPEEGAKGVSGCAVSPDRGAPEELQLELRCRDSA